MGEGLNILRTIIAAVPSGRLLSNPRMFIDNPRTYVIVTIIYIWRLAAQIIPSCQSDSPLHIQSSIITQKFKRGLISLETEIGTIETSSGFSDLKEETSGLEKGKDLLEGLASKSSADAESQGMSGIRRPAPSISRIQGPTKGVLTIRSRHAEGRQKTLSRIDTARSVLTRAMHGVEARPPTFLEQCNPESIPILKCPTLQVTHKYMSVRAKSSDTNDEISSQNLSNLLRSSFDPQGLTRVDQEPRMVPNPHVTLDEIKSYGREGWYKSQNLINSWEAYGVPAQDKPLMILLGEALQIWSGSFQETIAEWSPDFLNHVPTILWEKNLELGATRSTRSMSLKNYSMILRATAESTEQNMSVAMKWFYDILGPEEVTGRQQVLQEGYTKTEEEIVEKLVTGFAFRNDKASAEYKALYKEICIYYLPILKQAEVQILSRCTAKDIPTMETEIVLERARIYLDRELKVDQKWPVWSYTESVQVINRLHDPVMRHILEEHYVKQPFYMSRICQVNSTLDGICSRLVKLISDHKKGVEINSQETKYLTLIYKELPRIFKDHIKVQAMEYLGLSRNEFERLWKEMADRSVLSVKKVWKDVFERNNLGSSIIEKLFSLQFLRSMPDHYLRNIQKVRGRLDNPSRLDLDQKIAWLQDNSSENMEMVLQISITNFNKIVGSPKYSSAIGIDQHFLFESCKAIYLDNLPLWKEIQENLSDTLGQCSLSGVKEATQAALKQAWVQDTWAHFLEERLGYKKNQPIFEMIFNFGMALKFNEEYPTFLGISLNESYKTFCQTPQKIKETFKEIFHEEYEERSKLLIVFSIRQRLLETNPEEFRSGVISDKIFSHQKISEWLQVGGLSVPAVLAVVLHYSSQSSEESVSEFLDQSIRATLSNKLDLFGCLKFDDKAGLEYQALLRLLSSRSLRTGEDVGLQRLLRTIQQHHHRIQAELSES